MDATLPHETARRWLLATGCFALLLFFFSPPWGAFTLWARVPEMGGMIEVRRAGSVLYQVDHLGAEVPDELHGAIQWRLLFPLIGRLTQLPASALLGLSHVGALLMLAYAATVLRRHALPWLACAVALVLLGATSWFFTSMSWLGYYDSWLVLGLLVLAFGDSRWSVWSACIWAPWVDERFVLAAPLALLCRFLDPRTRAVTAANRKQEFAVAGALIVAFMVLRLGVLPSFSGDKATVGGYLDAFSRDDISVGRYLFGAWGGLRAAWLLVFLGVMLTWRRSPVWGVALAATAALVMGVGLGTAQDLSRSMMLLIPVAVLGAFELRGPGRSGQIALAAAALALLLPAHHVISNHVAPLFYLHHELAAVKNPPAAARSEWHELLGIQAMQRGDLVAAAEALSLAIKLAPNPASASKQRGVLFASQQQWAEARKDFSTMVQHQPKDPDGWFLRAQAALALGDVAAAQSDAAQAAAVAPAGWRDRPDVARFLARLEQLGSRR